MWYDHTGDRPVYAPNTVDRPDATWSDEQGPVDNGWEADGELVRSAYTLRAEDDDFGQAGVLVREVFDDAARDRLVETVSGMLGDVKEPVLSNVFQYWKNVDAEVGQRIQDAATQG